MLSADNTERVLRRVREIPEGFVRTYGDVSPGAPRFAGTVLASTDEDVPWWRVVRADGSLAQGDRQRRLLEAEGVPFKAMHRRTEGENVGQGDRSSPSSRVDLEKARIPRDAGFEGD